MLDPGNGRSARNSRVVASVSIAEFPLALDSRGPFAPLSWPSQRMKNPVAFLLLTMLCACGGSTEIEFGPPREVPKDKRPTVWGASTRDRLGVPSMTSPQSTPNDGGDSQADSALVANTPNGWEELPANPQRFRNAVWRVSGEPDTDCYLTIGVGGGVAFNLQRWYVNQFAKPKAPAVEELPEIDFCNRKGRLVELEGTMGQKQDWAALIAFFNDGNQVTSLKFTGPKATVAAQRGAFLALAGSIRLGKGKGGGARKAPPIDANQPLPPGHADIGQQAPKKAPFTAVTPDGWTAKKNSRRVLHHTFGRNSELYVSQLGGAMRQTLDIWRFELQLEAMTDEQFAALPNTLFLGDDAVLMDLTGNWRGMTGAKIDDARVLVAARMDGNTITFCKLVGPKSEVDAQRDAFVQFCGTVRKQ